MMVTSYRIYLIIQICNFYDIHVQNKNYFYYYAN